MQCPKCHSENTQRLQVVFESGTQHTVMTGTSYAVGAGGDGYGGGTATTYTTGISRSALASRAAPPARKSIQHAIGLIVTGLLLQTTDNWAFLGMGLIVGGGFLIVRAKTYNATTWVTLRTEWEKSWMCIRCGNMYTFPE